MKNDQYIDYSNALNDYIECTNWSFGHEGLWVHARAIVFIINIDQNIITDYIYNTLRTSFTNTFLKKFFNNLYLIYIYIIVNLIYNEYITFFSSMLFEM